MRETESGESYDDEGYGPDRVVGVIEMLLAGWLCVAGAVVSSAAAKSPQSQGGASLAMVIIIAIAAFSFLLALGIYHSRTWAFVVSAVFTIVGFALPDPGTGQSGAFSLLIGVASLLYYALRLFRVFGPPLR